MAGGQEPVGSASPDPRHIQTRQDLGKRLTELREAAGLPVRDLAKALKLPTSTVSGYLVGKHLPPLRFPALLPDLVRACGVVEADEVEEWVQALWRVRRGTAGRWGPSDDAPYRGLSGFQPEHARWFHGREAMTAATVHEVRANGVVVVVGASGSGKSSLLRAGLVPELGTVGPDDSPAWRIALLTPGPKPFAALAAACAELWEAPVEELITAARETPSDFLSVLGDLWRGIDEDGRLLLVIDQLEEVFTACKDPIERRLFLEAVCPEIAETEVGTTGSEPTAGRVAVAFGLRADFYEQALEAPTLARLLQNAQVVVAPMSRAELRRAITEPARTVGVAFEEGLADLLMQELAPAAPDPGAAHDPGALPLLGHALLATWNRRSRGILSAAAYRDTGGIGGAVARTAEDVFSRLTDDQQQLARRMFLRLVHVSDRTADTRRRATRVELVPNPASVRGSSTSAATTEQVDVVLEAFVENRLLTSSTETVEIAHEALLTAWPRLRSWVEEDRTGLRLHRKLGDAAAAWEENGRQPHHLYRGPDLSAADDWLADPTHASALNTAEREFLEQSSDLELVEHRARRRRARHLRQYAASLTVLVVLAALLASYAFEQRSTANEQRKIATVQRDSAISRQVAIEADQVRSTDTALAAQLAVAAYRISPTVEARSALLDSYLVPTTTRVRTTSTVVQAVAVAPDTRTMATSGVGGTAELWDLTDPQRPTLLAPLPTGSGQTLFTAAFSPDGHTLALGGAGPTQGTSTLVLWDVSDRNRPRLLGKLSGFTNTVYSAAFSSDGRLLAAGSADDTVRLWDVSAPANPQPVGGPLAGFSNYVQAVAFSPTGHLLAAGSRDLSVRLWDLTDPAAPHPAGGPLTGPTKPVYSLAFAPDGRRLAEGSGDHSVRLWDVSDPAKPTATGPVFTGPASWVNALTFNADGTELAAGGSDSKVWIWDTATGAVLAALPHPGPVAAATFLPHRATVLTGSADGYARLWQLPGPVVGPVGASVFTTTITRKHLLLSSSTTTATYMWDVSDPRAPKQIGQPLTAPPGTSPFSGALTTNPDGSLLAEGSNDGTVRLWDLADPSHPSMLPGVLTGLGSPVETLAFSPDGRTLVAGANENTIRLWDVGDHTKPRALPVLTGPGNYVFSVAFSPDGKTLAAGSADSLVRLWDVTSPASPVPLGGPLATQDNYVYSVAFSPDGKTLAAGSADHTVHLWDVTNRTHPVPLGPPLTGPDNTVYSVAFSPDGQTLAGANGEGTVWLWNLADRAAPSALATLVGSDAQLLTVGFDPLTSVLVAGGSDRRIRMWNIRIDQVGAQICGSVGQPITRAEWARYVQDTPYAPPCSRA
jgi:WD40 repeat protein/transcriptional regulator with XRE-family HTH domain/energy-coupling factor transporter ATP-binding protein EcfA2